jgi:hypothetical protein
VTLLLDTVQEVIMLQNVVVCDLKAKKCLFVVKALAIAKDKGSNLDKRHFIFLLNNYLLNIVKLFLQSSGRIIAKILILLETFNIERVRVFDFTCG